MAIAEQPRERKNRLQRKRYWANPQACRDRARKLRASRGEVRGRCANTSGGGWDLLEYLHYPRRVGWPPLCHPHRRHAGRGLCNPCAKTRWMRENAGNEKHEAYKKRAREEMRQVQKRLRMEILQQYGGAFCSWPGCGIDDIRVLQLDHIDGGGYAQRKELKVGTGTAFYAFLKRSGFPSGYRVLCANHNWIAHFERKENRLCR